MRDIQIENIKNTGAKEWVIDVAKSSYSQNSTVQHVHESFKNYLALYVTLLSGFYIMVNNLPVSHNQLDFIFVVVPCIIGFSIAVLSLSFTVFCYFWRKPKSLISPAKDLYNTCCDIDEEHDSEGVKKHLDNQLYSQFITFSSGNFNNEVSLNNKMHFVAKLGCFSFLFLIIAIPRFATTSYYHKFNNQSLQDVRE